MTEPGLVSVVVPAFNVAPWIADCVASVLGQTYRELELLVIDDGSTDGGGEIARHSAVGDDRASVIRTRNAGLAAARNEGLDAARGDWVAFVDGDDWVAPDYVERLVRGALAWGSDITVCGHWEASERGWLRECPITGQPVAVGPRDAVRRMLTGGGGQLVAWNKLYRASLFRESGVRYPVGRLYEDAFTTYRLLGTARRVAYLDKPLYFYRRRSGSITLRRVDRQVVDDNLAMLAELEAWLAEHAPGLETELDRFQVAARVHVLFRMAGCRSRDWDAWEAVSGWLTQHLDALVGNRFVGGRTKAWLRLLAASRPAAWAAAAVLYRAWHR